MSRSVQFSILFSLSLVFITQIIYAPLLLNIILALILLLLVWRYQQQRNTAVAKVLIGVLLSAGLAAIYLHYQTFIGVDAGVALLTTILFAKALEIKQPRDVIVLFNFALFVSVSLFLYSQSMWMAILILGCLLSCFLGFYRLQVVQFSQDQTVRSEIKTDLQHVVKLTTYALPFFILLFLFFPRLPPLWHIPIQNQQAVTGISDQMSPGDIAQLSQSSALAFRIVADMSRLPPRSELYWRALVLDQYDGTRWTSSWINQQAQQAQWIANAKTNVDYQYLPADQQQMWVTGLEQSIPLQPRFLLREDGGITPTRRVQRSQPIKLRWLGMDRLLEKQEELKAFQEKINTAIPQQKDQRAQQFARQMFTQSQSDPQRYIQNILHWYQQQKFVYTLAPGRLGENRIDEFLFQSRQGFCEHYASSFVMLMRYVGIPARVVVGYQGGQAAPDGQSWEVRQLDAHAWSEVWLDRRWQRIDPTAIIMPQRIDQGMQDLMASDQQIFGTESSNTWKYQQFSLLKNVRVWGDYASYQWQRKVVGYDSEAQKNWFAKLGLSSVYSSVLILVIGCIGLGIFYLMIVKLRQQQKIPVYQRYIQSFSRTLPGNLHKQKSETFQQWMLRLMQECPIDQQEIFQQLIRHYQKVIFLEQQEPKDAAHFKKMLKDCAFVLRQARKNLSEK